MSQAPVYSTGHRGEQMGLIGREPGKPSSYPFNRIRSVGELTPIFPTPFTADPATRRM